MRILILNWRDPKHTLAGGAEEMLLRHSSFWVTKGADVTWLASSFENSTKTDTIEGVKFIRIGNQYTVHFLFFWKYIFGEFRDYDLYVDCFHFIPFFTPFIVHGKKKIAIIHEIAGKIWLKNIALPLAIIGMAIEKFSFFFYKNVPFFTVSESTKKELIENSIKSNLIHVVHNGIDRVNSKSSKNKIFTILFLGRISEDKGISDALWVFKQLLEKGHAVQMYICGKEEYHGQFKEKIRAVGIESNNKVHYFGFVSTIKKFELLKKASILIHPSSKEGWGLSVIEAGSQHTPTVGYNVSGLVDSVDDGRTGILVNNKKEILREIEMLIKDRKKLNLLSSNAYKKAQKYNWKDSCTISWNLVSKIV